MKIIDFHLHPYLTEEEFIGKFPESFSPSPTQAGEDLRGCGISHICGSVIARTPYAPEKGFAYFRELNRKALELKERFGTWYTPGFMCTRTMWRSPAGRWNSCRRRGFG